MMLSSKLTAARPVRMVASFRRKSSMTVSIRGLVSLITSLSLIAHSREVSSSEFASCGKGKAAVFVCNPDKRTEALILGGNSKLGLFVHTNFRADPCFAPHDAIDISSHPHVENNDRQVVIHAE